MLFNPKEISGYINADKTDAVNNITELKIKKMKGLIKPTKKYQA